MTTTRVRPTSSDPVAKLERLLGSVETHSITCEGASLRGDLQKTILYLEDCKDALESLRAAAADVIAAHPCSQMAERANAYLSKGQAFFANAHVSHVRAWAKRGGNPQTITPTVVHFEADALEAAQ